MAISVRKRLETFFAPAEREPVDGECPVHRRLAAEPLLQTMLDAFPGPAMILNEQRQAVLVNGKIAELLNIPPAELLGLRPGEMLDCIHWRQHPWGCGTTVFCRTCGAVRAILESQQREAPDVQECRVVRDVNGETSALNLRVWATPILIDGDSFTIFAFQDITDEKRRAVLERLFFHDVLNAAGGLQGILDVWPELEGDEALAGRQMALDLVQQLVDEIQSARDLAAAERGDLQVAFEMVDVAALLSQLCTVYRHHTSALGKTISPPVISGTASIQSNGALLRRVIGNLIQNALEASNPGDTVTVSFHNDGQPAFSVHNESVMTEDVSLQLFQRSFSTKEGAGHGIGTYSVKLLTERYLGGTVDFASPAPEGGTTFHVRVPDLNT
jgi:signal transduction histidine kinase